MVASSRRLAAPIFAAIIGAVCISLDPTHAQNAPGTHQDNGGLNGSLSRGDLEKLSGDHNQSTDSEVPKDPALARAKAKELSAPLVKSLQIACEISDARLVAAGLARAASGKKEVRTRVYEVACSDTMGYLIETQGAETPVGISCLAAEEARASDVARGKEPSFFCKLPENQDVYAMVVSLINAGTGVQCAVSTLQSFGRSESAKSAYSEVACKDGQGFLLRTPLPGSQAKTIAMSCADAAKQGIKCRLTDPGPIETPVTLDTFKGALAQNGVSCNIGKIRLIGQEDHLRRYVVEYLCADQAAGMVAFIPLPGNTNPYEALDCSTAALSQIQCRLMPAQ
jgi:hypothetical protein